ncbi:MAG: tetratricopeptide repeat protein [Bacteroidales bacterium]|nr:tetratricopeptide repeat protein [Bacteroidales bacterium]
MKEIKVFLASSEELEQDREAFGNFIRRLDNLYEKRGIRIRLFEWEDLDSAYNDKRKQDEYNEYIKQSDIFLALFRTKAGKFTVEEFNLAKDLYKNHGLPKPHVYCRDLNEGETEDKTLTDFKKDLFENLKYFFARYTSRDSLNLHFVMQLQLFENSLENKVDVDGDKLVYEGINVGRVDKIDFFAKNKDFIRMREDLKDLNEDIEDLLLRQASAPEDEKLKNRIQEKQNKRNALQEEFEHYRKDILDFEKHIISLQGKRMDELEVRATELFSQGKVTEARIILKESRLEDEQIEKDWDSTIEKLDAIKENMERIIKKAITDAKLVMLDTTISIEKRKEEAKKVYSDADRRAQKINYSTKEYIELLLKYGIFLADYAYYEEALEVDLRFIRLSEATNGQNDITAGAYNNIGIVYDNLGDYDKALEYYFKALEIKKAVLGENNADTAGSYNNIGLVYKNLGDYNKALEYHNKALEIRKDVLGENHPDIAMSYNNIGVIYNNLGDYNKALEFHSKALEIRKEVLGEKNVDIAMSYNNIGSVYYNLGNYNEALKLYNKALEIKREVLGEKHADTAGSYNNIGIVYKNLGDYDKALEYYNKALEIRKEVLGEKHRDTADSYNNIGVVYDDLEDYDKALKFYNKALEIRKEVLGEKHPNTAMSYGNIGVAYYNLENYNKALELYNKALEIFKERLGESHPYTQQTIRNIERAKQKLEESQGKAEEPKKKKGFWSRLFGE